MVLVYSPVGEYQDVCPVSVCLVNLYEKTVDGTLQFGALII